MKILFLGDIIGKPGRDAVAAHLPRLRSLLSPDLVIANGENAAHGFGITRSIAEEYFAIGIDVITTGNHWADQKEILTVIETEDRILRPQNYPPGTPGQGATVVDVPGGRRALVINVMGRLFMDPLDDPFRAVQAEVQKHRMGQHGTVQAVAPEFATAVLRGDVQGYTGATPYVIWDDRPVLVGALLMVALAWWRRTRPAKPAAPA